MSDKPTLDEIHESSAMLEDCHVDAAKFNRLIEEFKAKNGRDANIEERREIDRQCQLFAD